MRTAGVLHAAIYVAAALSLIEPAFAQDGTVLTNMENQVAAATQGWETRVMNAATSLFWILAGIEVGIAAVWLAIQSPSLDSWFAEIVRRILFIGFFLFVLQQGPTFAKAVVDSLFQIGANGGTASPADVFNAGISVAHKLSEQIKFGLFDDIGMAIAAVIAMAVVVICFSLVAAIFISILVEMYVGLLAGMIMLGLGGSSFTKDFAIRYLVYAFGVGMKLMALVMIARIGSEVLIGMANDARTGEEWLTSFTIAGISVVVFMIALQVPNIVQGVVQGVSVSNGMEAMRASAQIATFAQGGFAGAVAGRTSAKDAGGGIVAQSMGAAKGAGGAMAQMSVNRAMGVPGSGHASGSGSSGLGLSNPKARASKSK